MQLDDFINWPMLREPYNWLIVIGMITVVYMLLMLIIKPATELESGTLAVI